MKVILYSNDIHFIDRHKKLFASFNSLTTNNYSELYSEAKKENVVIIINLEEINENINDFITPLVEINSYIMILDKVPSYERGKELISLGIRAYANLMIDDIHMKDAINSVMDGNIWLYPEFINETVLRMQYESSPKKVDDRLNILTSREKEVALLVLEKLPYLDISEKLNISIRTVKAHTKHIYEKFNVSNRLAFLLLFK